MNEGSYVGFFRDPDSNRWSSKMENSLGRNAFRQLMTEATGKLPDGAELIERTNISADGMRVFAGQLKHGWETTGEYYECGLNAEDKNNVLGKRFKGNGEFGSIFASEQELEGIRTALKPYLESLGLTTDNVYLDRSGKVVVRMPVLRKKDAASKGTPGQPNVEAGAVTSNLSNGKDSKNASTNNGNGVKNNENTQKKWSEMTMDERMKEAETNPLTKEQVEAYTGDDVIKANALAYINGKEDLINSIAYLKVYEDVRNSNGGHTQDNGTKDGTQLAQTDNAVNQTGGLGTRGTGGESAEQMDRGSRTADVSGKRSDVQNGEGRTDTNAGAQGDSTIPVEGKPVVGSDTGSNGREGSGTDSANGRDGKRRGSKTGGTASTDTRSRSDVSQRKGSKGNDQPKKVSKGH